MSATSMLSPGSERPVMNGMKKPLKPIKQSNIKIKETPGPTDGLPILTQPKNNIQPAAQGY